MNPDLLHARLVERLDTTEPIRAAFAAHPRHRYVPAVVWPTSTGLPLLRSADPARWLELVYSDEPVTTQANDGGAGVVNTPSSSSSAPQVMADMIGAARVGPGARVLEIGTGTGWNAAILSSLVGPTGRVCSVEIDPGVAAHARARLEGTGVRVTTGTEPPEGLYDAVIATCSARRIPGAWREALAPDGLLVVPWAPYVAGGPTPLAALTAQGADGLAGAFVRDGSFMRDRTQRVPAGRFPGTGGKAAEAVGRFPLGSAELLDQDLLTRLALTCPGVWITVGGRPWEGGHAPIVALERGDSWAHVWPDGTTTGGGPADVAGEVAESLAVWGEAGRPALEEFALEAPGDGGPYLVRHGALPPWQHPV